jgi:hypothetical protein
MYVEHTSSDILFRATSRYISYAGALQNFKYRNSLSLNLRVSRVWDGLGSEGALQVAKRKMVCGLQRGQEQEMQQVHQLY